MIKSTALVSLVTLWDVMSVALKIRNDTLVTYMPLLVAGAIYFVLNYLIGRGFLALEYWLSPHLRAPAALNGRSRRCRTCDARADGRQHAQAASARSRC